MAALVTYDEVQLILEDEGSDLTESVINTFITGADAIINEVFASTTLAAATLKEIERWLTAHLIVSTIKRMGLKEAAGGASITYMGSFDKDLGSTPYGQMAKVLDTTGVLAALGGKEIKIKAITSFD